MKRLLAAALVLAITFPASWFVSRSRTFQLFGEIVPRVEMERRLVALTFDDGPRAAALPEILEPLAQNGVQATFFLCGAQMEEQPGVAEALVAAGHELGNHSWSHRRMVLKSPAFIAGEIEKTDALIRAAGHQGTIHFRAPYGKKLLLLPWYLQRRGRIHVTWDVEPESDPAIDADAARIAEHVLERVRPGSIILLHPWYGARENTRKALPAIVEGLRARGYELVTVSELLRHR
ncbi:MAG TPA: polysaccharide deacetylase family protein [Thermoanaerobaculia bacterium]|nr:polysaccharide deacetylase family protein [Thermoanaerobaculia bacterium]